MTMLVSFLIGAICVVGVWKWSIGGAGDARRAAVVASLATLASVFNLVVPLPSVEVTTLVVVCCAVMVDVRVAISVGVICTLAGGAFAGVGPWTVWQVLGLVLVAVLVGSSSRWLRSLMLDETRVAPTVSMVVVVSVMVYDVITTAGGLVSVTGSTRFIDAMLLGVPFMVVHVVTSCVLAWIAAPSLVRALHRVRSRNVGTR